MRSRCSHRCRRCAPPDTSQFSLIHERVHTMSTQTQTKLAPADNVINGIDTDALQMLIETVDADRAKATTHWRVGSTWQGGTSSRAQVDGFTMGGVQVSRSFS